MTSVPVVSRGDDAPRSCDDPACGTTPRVRSGAFALSPGGWAILRWMSRRRSTGLSIAEALGRAEDELCESCSGRGDDARRGDRRVLRLLRALPPRAEHEGDVAAACRTATALLRFSAPPARRRDEIRLGAVSVSSASLRRGRARPEAALDAPRLGRNSLPLAARYGISDGDDADLMLRKTGDVAAADCRREQRVAALRRGTEARQVPHFRTARRTSPTSRVPFQCTSTPARDDRGESRREMGSRPALGGEARADGGGEVLRGDGRDRAFMTDAKGRIARGVVGKGRTPTESAADATQAPAVELACSPRYV